MIDTNIPLPESRVSYSFGDMSVGDSVFYEAQNSQGKAMKAANSHGNYHGKKFAARAMDGGVRIWRVA